MEYKESIIIRNASDMLMTECMLYITSVIQQGRISDDGKSYCFATRFSDNVIVVATRRKCSDVFAIWKEEPKCE